MIAINCNHLHFGLGVPLSHAPKTAFSSYNASTSSLVFDAREPLCVKYKRLRRVVGYCLAHKAQWHNERTIPIYVSAEFPFCERCFVK